MGRHRMDMVLQGPTDMGHRDLTGMVHLMGMVYLMCMTFHLLMDTVRPRGPPVGWRWSRPLFPSNHIWR